MSVFEEVAVLLAIASAVGFLGVALRQPLIVSFIAVGILAGPAGLAFVRTGEVVETLARLGVSLLLFLVGLKLDLGLIRSFGRVAAATGLGQVVFTSIGGVLLCLALGLNRIESLYVAIALTFSSTIIVVKLLSDKREIDSLHGRIALGLLIVQDLCVVVAMIVLTAIGAAGGENGLRALALTAGGGVALIAVTALFIRFLAEPLLVRLAREAELLVLFAIAWAAIGAATADSFGLSKELGGLIAGVSLGSTSVRETIAARLAPLRDFLLLFFFLQLGAVLDFSTIAAELWPAVVLSLFVLVGKPVLIMALIGAMGYRKRTSFLAGVSLAQISEFSLVFIALGHDLGHVGRDAVGLVTLVGIVTIGLSTFMTIASGQLYARLERFLGPFERRTGLREDHLAGTGEAPARPVVLCGLGRYGTAIARRLCERGVGFLGVDFDPEAVRAFQRRGWPAIYGDITDPVFVSHLPIDKAEWVVVAVPHLVGVLGHADTADALIAALRHAGFRGKVALTATYPHQEARLKALGADLILSPFIDAAREAVDRILAARPAAVPAPA